MHESVCVPLYELRWSDSGLRPRYSQFNVLTGEANAISSAKQGPLACLSPAPVQRSPRLCKLGTWKSKSLSDYSEGDFSEQFPRLKCFFVHRAEWVLEIIEKDLKTGRVTWREGILAASWYYCLKAGGSVRFCTLYVVKEQTFPFFFPESHDAISVIENNLLKLLFN